MPQKIISLLDGCPEVNLYYFREYKFAGDIQYLQSIRSGAITEESLIALSYKAMAQFYASRLAAMVGGSYDAIVMAPSSRNDAEPYFEALKQTAAIDCTSRFSRTNTARAGESTTTLTDLLQAIEYEREGDESELKSLLIVDDVFSSGKTVRALVSKLRDAGLQPDCRIVVAVPLLVE